MGGLIIEDLAGLGINVICNYFLFTFLCIFIIILFIILFIEKLQNYIPMGRYKR